MRTISRQNYRGLRRVGSAAGVCAIVIAAVLAVDTLPLAVKSIATDVSEDPGESKPSAKPAALVCTNMACSTGDPGVPCCCADEDSRPVAAHAVSSMSPCADMGGSTGVAVLVLSSRDLPDRASPSTMIDLASISVALRIGDARIGVADLPDRVPIA